jgi:Protein of unknown function (DUF4065)
MPMQFPVHSPETDADKRLAEMILYVSQKCASDYFFGETKLHKILFFSDFSAFGDWGRTITGVEYHHQDQGPMVRRMLPVMQTLKNNQALAMQPTNCGGFRQNRPVNLRDPDLSLFSGAEIALVDGWIERLRSASATQVSKMSHDTAAWRLTDSYETIDPRTVWIGWTDPTAAEIQRGRELAEKYGYASIECRLERSATSTESMNKSMLLELGSNFMTK